MGARAPQSGAAGAWLMPAAGRSAWWPGNHARPRPRLEPAARLSGHRREQHVDGGLVLGIRGHLLRTNFVRCSVRLRLMACVVARRRRTLSRHGISKTRETSLSMASQRRWLFSGVRASSGDLLRSLPRAQRATPSLSSALGQFPSLATWWLSWPLSGIAGMAAPTRPSATHAAGHATRRPSRARVPG